MVDGPWASQMALRLYQRAALVLMVVLVGTVSLNRGVTDASVDRLLQETVRRWCGVHGKREDLQAVLVDVRFRAEPPLFSKGEGVVVAPLGLDLPGAQRVLDVASEPGHLRKLTVQGIQAVAWEYSGRVHRDMRFAAVALVERAPLEHVTPPDRPTFDGLATDERPEALAKAADLEEHGLHKCAAFSEWTKQTAGAPPYTEQILRLVRAVAKPYTEKQRENEDLCANIRENRLTPHRKQVAVVMAARELGIPAYGFASASERKIHLVGTYVDGSGWILVDVEHPEEGWFTGGPPLLTLAPLLGKFEAAQHEFWSPTGGAYQKTQWGVWPISSTEWRGRLEPGKERTDTTEAKVLRLSEVCQ